MAQKHLVGEVAMVQAQVSRSLSQMRERGLVSMRRSADDFARFQDTARAIALVAAGGARQPAKTEAMSSQRGLESS